MKEYAQDFSAQGTVEKKIADYGTAHYKQGYRNLRSNEVPFCSKETLGGEDAFSLDYPSRLGEPVSQRR